MRTVMRCVPAGRPKLSTSFETSSLFGTKTVSPALVWMRVERQPISRIFPTWLPTSIHSPCRSVRSSWSPKPLNTFALEHSARLSGALLLQVLRVAQPLRLREVLRRETERAWPVTLAVVTGILGAVGNIVFRGAISGCKWLFQDQAARLGGGIPLALVAGGLVLLVLDRLFPGEVLGYGFPRFLEMLHLQGARVKRRWMVVKTLGSAVSLGAGAAVGREGPIAQIGGSIGSAVAQLARLSSEQRKILIACGAAAGIATTFNAPLGALMFAHEIVLLGEVRLVNFTQIVIATTTAVVVSRGRFGS